MTFAVVWAAMHSGGTMVLGSLFGGYNFQSTIRDYCRSASWEIADLEDRSARLEFHMDSGRQQVVFITQREKVIEFAVPSVMSYESADDIDADIAIELLERNSRLNIGFWCLATVDDEFTFTTMYNIDREQLNAEAFANIVNILINECDQVEGEYDEE
jgi:hypothetical protein